ncbi:MAG: bifunctional diaminohydroxyphosphoribosylaminopyrimidine deaminase/5-amino-6-(5-phosphoribosylamino)uracil reductase RibD [Kiritimatiellae bacterium]|nr:bifunctional diaminohydroxyphosphoribosylaminopyrimidine deaminase/5-amino-6-(5-phosphoribosylamino)uracil reductase RibD [Kiritimatiellia bacterium]
MKISEKFDPCFAWRAVELAARGEGHTRPNPPVGAVIVRGGKIVGEGWHRRCGGDHAEVAAIKDAARRGESVRGATLYVTLEPCSRPGRVGACTDAIVAAGIGRVAFAVRDPNPVNSGRAGRVLSRAGVECAVPSRANTLEGKWDPSGGMASALAAARRLIAPFAKYVTTGMPYVTVKLAMSLDGKSATGAGTRSGYRPRRRERSRDASASAWTR